MQTRSSSPLQPHEAPPAPPEAPAKAQWTEADEITLIDYITEHKAEARDGMKFKLSFWTGATKEMISHSNFGGMKTPQGCYKQLCFFFSSSLTCDCLMLFTLLILTRVCLQEYTSYQTHVQHVFASW
jgi:hypothetical protein